MDGGARFSSAQALAPYEGMTIALELDPDAVDVPPILIDENAGILAGHGRLLAGKGAAHDLAANAATPAAPGAAAKSHTSGAMTIAAAEAHGLVSASCALAAFVFGFAGASPGWSSGFASWSDGCARPWRARAGWS
mgnify:CR=1 FL=1